MNKKKKKTETKVALAIQSFDQSDRLISRLRSKFFDQYSGDDNLLQGHLMVVSVL